MYDDLCRCVCFLLCFCWVLTWVYCFCFKRFWMLVFDVCWFNIMTGDSAALILVLRVVCLCVVCLIWLCLLIIGGLCWLLIALCLRLWWYGLLLVFVWFRLFVVLVSYGWLLWVWLWVELAWLLWFWVLVSWCLVFLCLIWFGILQLFILFCCVLL